MGLFKAFVSQTRKPEGFLGKMKVDGMMCGMCEAHVCDAIRKAVPAARKVAASRSKKHRCYRVQLPERRIGFL